MAAGRDRAVGRNHTRKLADAASVPENNRVMGITGTTGVIALCNNTQKPYAIFYGTTQDRIALKVGTVSYLIGSSIDSDSPLFDDGWAELPLDVDHGIIGIGDLIVVGPADDGTVVGPAGTGGGDPTMAADLLRKVGWAEEIIAAPGGGLRTKSTVLVKLALRN